MVYLNIYIINEMLFRGVPCDIKREKKKYNDSRISRKGELEEKMNY